MDAHQHLAITDLRLGDPPVCRASNDPYLPARSPSWQSPSAAPASVSSGRLTWPVPGLSATSEATPAGRIPRAPDPVVERARCDTGRKMRAVNERQASRPRRKFTTLIEAPPRSPRSPRVRHHCRRRARAADHAATTAPGLLASTRKATYPLYCVDRDPRPCLEDKPISVTHDDDPPSLRARR